MKRREFLATSAAATAISATASASSMANSDSAKFKLHYAPHFGMFKNLAGKDPIDQLKFAADQGFTAWEDNGMKRRSPDLQEKIAKTMSDLGMKMGVFVAHASFGKPTFVKKR